MLEILDFIVSVKERTALKEDKFIHELVPRGYQRTAVLKIGTRTKIMSRIVV